MRLNLPAALLMVLAVCPMAAAGETLDERRARVEQMDAEQKDQLLQNYQRFVRLDEAERERLRKLDKDLESAADQAELRALLQRYHDWLFNELQDNQRAAILSAAPEERLEKIESIITAQKRQEGFRLGSADVEAMRNWMQKNGVDWKLWIAMREGGDKPAITEEQLKELHASLSEDGRAKLDAAVADDARHKGNRKGIHRSVAKLLLTWAGQTMPRRGMMGRPGGGPGGGPSGGPGGSGFAGGGQRGGFRRPSETELQEFLKNDFSEDERAGLLELPHDEMQGMLRKAWMMREFRRHDDRQRGGGPGGFRGGGPGGPGQPGGLGPGDERRPRGGPGDKPRGERQRRPADEPSPDKSPTTDKAPPDAAPAGKPANDAKP